MILERYDGDWDRMVIAMGRGATVDDATDVLHGALNEIRASTVTQQQQQHSITLSRSGIGHARTLLTRNARAEWELEFSRMTHWLARPYTCEQWIRTQRSHYEDACEVQVAQVLANRADVARAPTAERVRCAPGLFQYRQSFDFSVLQAHVLAASPESFPLLRSVIADPDQLVGAWLLPDALELVRLATAQFENCVTREDAVAKLTVADMLDGHEHDVALQCAWRGFCQAWNLGKHMGVPIECGTVTPTGIDMSRRQAVAYLLPTNEDHGLLAKALLTVLTRQHNTLCALADERLAAQSTRRILQKERHGPHGPHGSHGPLDGEYDHENENEYDGEYEHENEYDGNVARHVDKQVDRHVDKHTANRMVGFVGVVGALGGGGVAVDAAGVARRSECTTCAFAREHAVCASFSGPQDAVNALCTFVQRHCLQYAEHSGTLDIDLELAEDWVARELVGGAAPLQSWKCGQLGLQATPAPAMLSCCFAPTLRKCLSTPCTLRAPSAWTAQSRTSVHASSRARSWQWPIRLTTLQ